MEYRWTHHENEFKEDHPRNYRASLGPWVLESFLFLFCFVFTWWKNSVLGNVVHESWCNPVMCLASHSTLDSSAIRIQNQKCVTQYRQQYRIDGIDGIEIIPIGVQ